jgi:CDP-glucose 4,6-dehydratase
MENLGINMFETYKNKKVFITGNTGFKGSWLSGLLDKLGAHVEGYALEPNTIPSHFSTINLGYKTTFANILDTEKLNLAIEKASPDIIFHLAAQALVRSSYTDPVNTYQSNVIGTLNVLEAARKCNTVKAIVLITTDKVYENKETDIAYTEEDELGGYDMYSSSKACCEILIKSYRNSFYNVSEYKKTHSTLLASARAGNVIGGGDWSADRLIPDIVKATAANNKVLIRNPNSVRPWQHVLDCLIGYLLLGEKLLQGNIDFAKAWNFSPFSTDAKNVKDIADIAKQAWEEINIDFGLPIDDFHEAGLLVLDNTKAIEKLGWKPIWNTRLAVMKTIEWYKSYYKNDACKTHDDIEEYLKNLNN